MRVGEATDSLITLERQGGGAGVSVEKAQHGNMVNNTQGVRTTRVICYCNTDRNVVLFLEKAYVPYSVFSRNCLLLIRAHAPPPLYSFPYIVVMRNIITKVVVLVWEIGMIPCMSLCLSVGSGKFETHCCCVKLLR